VSETYEKHQASFTSGLQGVQKWKKAKKVSEYIGFAVVLGAYFLKLDFWSFLVIVLAVLAVYLWLWNRERASFAGMKKELDEITSNGELGQLELAEQLELTKLFQQAAKEVK